MIHIVHNVNYDEFSKKLKYIRSVMGITQKEMVELLNNLCGIQIGIYEINGWESAEAKVNIGVIDKVDEILDAFMPEIEAIGFEQLRSRIEGREIIQGLREAIGQTPQSREAVKKLIRAIFDKRHYFEHIHDGEIIR